MSTLSATGNDRIVQGGNNPPAFDAHKANIDDLRTEAEAWLDGKLVESAEEAEAIDLLIKMARSARDEADKARAAEKKPHDDAAKAVQAKWKPLVDNADRILKVCLEKVASWRVAEQQRKEAEAARIRAEAEAKAAAAQRAMQVTSGGDLGAREIAERAVEDAKAIARNAKRAEREAQTGNGLRTTYRAELADQKAAVAHYWATRREDFISLINDLAAKDVRAGKRQIPGFIIHEEQKAF